MSKFIRLFNRGTTVSGTSFNIYREQIEEVYTGGFEIGKIKIKGVGTDFVSDLSVGDIVAIGTETGTQTRTITRPDSAQKAVPAEDESYDEDTGEEVIVSKARSATREITVPNRRILYKVDSITSTTEFITQSYVDDSYNVDPSTSSILYNEKGLKLSFSEKYPREAGIVRVIDGDTVVVDAGNTYTVCYNLGPDIPIYANLDHIITYSQNPNNDAEMFVSFNNGGYESRGVSYFNQVEKLNEVIGKENIYLNLNTIY